MLLTPPQTLKIDRSALKIIGLAVTSKDGFIASPELAHTKSWASSQDFEYLQSRLNQGGLCVMGRVTHEMYPNIKKRSRLIFSTQEQIDTDCETFINAQNPKIVWDKMKELASKLNQRNVYILGGEKIYTYFLKHFAYDEFALSIENKVTLGSGTPLFSVPEPFGYYDFEKESFKGLNIFKFSARV